MMRKEVAFFLMVLLAGTSFGGAQAQIAPPNWESQLFEDTTSNSKYYANTMGSNQVEIVMEPNTGRPHIITIDGTSIWEKWIDGNGAYRNELVCNTSGFIEGTTLGVSAAFSANGNLGVVVTGGGQIITSPRKMYVKAYYAEKRGKESNWSNLSVYWKVVYSAEHTTAYYIPFNVPVCYVKLGYDWNATLNNNRAFIALGSSLNYQDALYNMWTYTQVAVIDAYLTDLSSTPPVDKSVVVYNGTGNDPVIDATCMVCNPASSGISYQYLSYSLYKSDNAAACGIYRATAKSSSSNALSVTVPSQIIPSTVKSTAHRRPYLSMCDRPDKPGKQWYAYSEEIDGTAHTYSSYYVDPTWWYSWTITAATYTPSAFVGSIFANPANTDNPIVTMLFFNPNYYRDGAFHSKIAVTSSLDYPLTGVPSVLLYNYSLEGLGANDCDGWLPIVGVNPFATSNANRYHIVTQAKVLDAQSRVKRFVGLTHSLN